jgi:hypothetical protein
MRVRRGFGVGVVLGVLIGRFVAGGLGGPASAQPAGQAAPAPRDHAELAKLYDQDQADRRPQGGGPIDWSVVLPRDQAREARIKALYEAGELRTGKDFHRAAMILQHAPRPEDHLLAHEFCVVALAKGQRDARWLAAASEDRYLMSVGRPQRFGTQYRAARPDQPVRLHEVEPGVTDALRREMGVPSLAQARQREALMEEQLKGKKPAATKR